VRKFWTANQLDVLQACYPNTPTVKLAEQIGRTPRSVYQKALQLGLRKSAEYMATEAAGRLDGIRGGATRFKKGLTPWNKGLKGLLHEGSKPTQFKPGQMPHNTHPIGSYRVTKDGTLQRKISNAKGSNSVRWRGVHELVWVEANGPVPAGHIVVFKPGQRTGKLEEITASRVECISFGENMRRNTVHNLPPELVKAVQLIGALNRKINNVKQHQ
jgi:hypothetical protein